MPTSSLYNDSEHWRSRADEVRSIAEGMKDALAKRIMFRIAADYEKLAIRAEIRASDGR